MSLMASDGLAAKIAALPAEERAARYLEVVRGQGLSMAAMNRELAAAQAKIKRLEKKLRRLSEAG